MGSQRARLIEAFAVTLAQIGTVIFVDPPSAVRFSQIRLRVNLGCS